MSFAELLQIIHDAGNPPVFETGFLLAGEPADLRRAARGHQLALRFVPAGQRHDIFAATELFLGVQFFPAVGDRGGFSSAFIAAS